MSSDSASSSSSPAPTSSSDTTPPPNVASCCPHEKLEYEKCFQTWYNGEYLTGKSTDLSSCATEFNSYRSCVLSFYEKNEPEFLKQAGVVSDQQLKDSGHEPFNAKHDDQGKKEAK